MDETTRRGRLSISRANCKTASDDFVRIELVDQASRTECVEIDVPLVAFANALFGRSRLPVTFRLQPDRVGMRYEHKTETIPLARYPSSRDPAYAAAVVAPYEVDGWIGRDGDVLNHHNLRHGLDGSYAVEVSFSRWVEPQPGWEPER